MSPDSPEEVRAGLAAHGYLADPGLATALFLALRLDRPLLLEGEAGVGKTEVARTVAAWLGTDLLRLQCYEGIDAAQAIYEWDYARQLLHLRTAEVRAEGAQVAEDELFTERFLVRRPLLEAIAPTTEPGRRRVLLVDEVDRADDEFEALLLEVLGEYAVSIPELGTLRAAVPPVVVLTSNRTREIHDALKRRCLYHWLALPDFEREVAIVRLRAPEVDEGLVAQVVAAVGRLRAMDLYKPPGVAETIDWAEALGALGASCLDGDAIEATLGSVVKYQEDTERVLAADTDELAAEAIRRAG